MDDSRPAAFNLGRVESIAPGHGRSYVVAGEEIAVFRQRNGRILAVQNRCPHRHGPLADGIVGNGKVVCPLHAHRFDLESGEGSEKHECVRTYPVQVLNGEIIVTVALPAVVQA
ncbi:MAG TPA: Rieske 2Fe-2S domain-containing protein [Planctomycetota bacterium]|nr:Rieske 2Fe-2S domain-containing protein [Planctomycetota bacterium]